MKIKEALTYNDVLLEPQYSDIKSRAEVSIGSALDGPYAYVPLRLPIIASLRRRDGRSHVARRGTRRYPSLQHH